MLILKGGVARALTQAFNFGIAVPVMMALTFIVFTATGGELTPRRVFTTLSLIGFLRRSSIAFIVRCFFLVYEARVATVRIQVSKTYSLAMCMYHNKLLCYMYVLKELLPAYKKKEVPYNLLSLSSRSCAW